MKTTVKLNRYEPCKFDEIAITETETKDGKASTSTVKVFDNGKGLKSAKRTVEKVTTSIYFKFDVDVVDEKSKQALQNVLNFLLEHPHSGIRLEGFACVIGKQNYNNGLSQRRSDAVKKFFLDGGLKADRILSIGKGEVNATDDKQGRDNIKYKDEFDYIHNRRVDVSFTFEGHNAQTLKYYTIAPCDNKNLFLEVKGFETKSCFKTKDKHIKKIKIDSITYNSPLSKNVDKINIPVHSPLEKWNLFPIQYLWPTDSANSYYVFINSCRYYSNEKDSIILIKAFPDIKWKFDLYTNLSNKLSIKWQKLSKERHAEMRSNALKLANEAKGKYSEVDFGCKIEASFNKSQSGNYQSNRDITLKYTDKIKKLFSLISSIKEISKGITEVTKGKISKTKSGTNLPFTVELIPPTFHFGSEWELDLNELKNDVGIKIKLYLQADPFVALSLTIDLLCMALQAGVAVSTGGTGNVAALRIFNEIRAWAEEGYESENAKISLKMYIDLVITGSINGSIDGTFSTINKDKEINLEFGNKLSVELKSGVNLKAMIVIVGTVKKPVSEAHAEGELSAGVKIGITSGHNLKYDSNVGVFYQPKLEVDPCIGQVILKIRVGFSYKKVSSDWTPLDYNATHEFFPKFDIINNLSNLF
ncbi:hypothetical protein BWK58_14875, partial [Flavobacterium columnare]